MLGVSRVSSKEKQPFLDRFLGREDKDFLTLTNPSVKHKIRENFMWASPQDEVRQDRDGHPGLAFFFGYFLTL
jgi:hypothetical protein